MVWSLQTPQELTDQQFDDWSKLLEDRAGICMRGQQRIFLQTQVSMRMRELGVKDYSQYLATVMDGVAGMMEWSILIDRLVVKETSFFRHKPSIDHARNYLQGRINNGHMDGSFDVWSVGCSSGEEPYSLSMVFSDIFEFAQLDPYFGITATDISRPALTIARNGIYSRRKVEMIDNHIRQRYFGKIDNQRYKINDRLKERICFNQANVLDINDMPSIKLDLIFCQNLLIYFRRWLRHEIMNAYVERLKPGGIIVIGLGEVVDWMHRDVSRVPVDEAQVYVRH